jgi:hypothetical protein
MPLAKSLSAVALRIRATKSQVIARFRRDIPTMLMPSYIGFSLAVPGSP